ncbi:MAG: hypothetical protein HIU83_15775 [Proteobacteria bacterium]|nr:hypothetical protein [Pseudomonadota bacterium]
MGKLTDGFFTSLSVLAIVAMGALGIATIMFIPKFASMVYPYLMALTGLGVGLVIIMLPFTFFTRLRSAIATITLVISYLIGAGFWAYSAIVAYKIWGMTGLIAGLVFAGVGVVPVAFLACIFNAEWMVVFNILFAAFLTFGTRGLSIYILSKALIISSQPPATNANPPPMPQGNILEEMLNGPPVN